MSSVEGTDQEVDDQCQKERHEHGDKKATRRAPIDAHPASSYVASAKHTPHLPQQQHKYEDDGECGSEEPQPERTGAPASLAAWCQELHWEAACSVA